eukprot:TRINITY_DN27133_c0_g1_i1.p1 TRINITY_DN27133_c0_g1~~TRINITY_DN27133_c0_g1_i1.p1  ORF type:complete len:298 (+),score=54.62 TRINITY_DN27133_c0_g1_i1:71-964(+)
MSSGSAKGKGDLDTVVLRHVSGAVSEIYLFGATVASYKTPDGKDQIFMSPGAIYDGKKALRGGVPLVFPQFGQENKAMPQHGVARTSLWALKSVQDSVDESVAVLELKDSEATRGQWDHAFALEYRVSLTAASLTMRLRVVNTGDAPFDFQALLHTYLQIPEISEIAVRGIQGRTYADKVDGGAKKEQTDPDVVLPSFTDRIYLGESAAEKDLLVGRKGGAPCFAVSNKAEIDHKGGIRETLPCDVVIWNPYEEASPGDLPPPAFKQFVCVEPGMVAKLHELGPGKVADLSQKIMPL